MPQEHDSGLARIKTEGLGIRYPFLNSTNTTLKGRALNLIDSRYVAADFWALRNVSVEFGSGEIIGVVGSNGSGKSTLLRAIARIIPPAEGSVQVAGDIRPLLDMTGGMNMALTGRGNAYLMGALNRIPRQTITELLPQIVEFSELGVFFDSPVKTYSSGMIARLAFTLATRLQPDVLLVDEILSVGDERFQQKSYFRITKLIEKGSLAIIVSHNLNFIEQICTRAILLSQGRMEMDGTPSSVIDRYRKSFR